MAAGSANSGLECPCGSARLLHSERQNLSFTLVQRFSNGNYKSRIAPLIERSFLLQQFVNRGLKLAVATGGEVFRCVADFDVGFELGVLKTDFP